MFHVGEATRTNYYKYMTRLYFEATIAAEHVVATLQAGAIDASPLQDQSSIS